MKFFLIMFLLGMNLCQESLAQEPPKIPWRTLQQGLNYRTGEISTSMAKLNGQIVQVPGFAVPLDGSELLVKEFLLVPTYGACIHVPAPPPNQVVYVTMEKGVPMELLDGPVWVLGQLSVTTQETEFAEAGYVLSGLSVEEFQMEPL